MRIFLLGFMGSGKSYWGHRWSLQYDIPYYDLDLEIENETQLSITEIFESKGEDYFRRAEADALRKMGLITNGVIACGGGTPCFHENMNWINAHGESIFLDAAPAFLLENIKKEKGRRPLIDVENENELLFFIEKKLKERMPFYTKAKHRLQAKEITVTSLDNIIN
ncbi:MAG: shikimate kinase [Ferruginibacter sp.]|nr:shikimate kinase [Ferruginibacter sp.]